ncbi:MAG: AAA family ATPase [Methylophilaceae bacterium]|nr:AAA family ATPase [Methylophilaceae bacterium]
MKLKWLHLKDFRCFDELGIDFDDKLTVIVADNGAGKTAILDAIAIGFGRYLTKLKWPGVPGRTFQTTDLRVTQGERRAPFMLILWNARTKESELVWMGGRKRDSTPQTMLAQKHFSEELIIPLPRGYKGLDTYTQALVQADTEQQEYFLPVIAYYGTNRVVRDEVKRRRGFKKNFHRFDALAGALEPDSRFRTAFEWFNAMEDAERRERIARRDFDYQHPELEGVRKAIVRMLSPQFSNPRTEARPLRFVIDRHAPDGTTSTLRIGQLSDGYRTVLGLVMDFARRLMEANSWVIANGENPLDLPAIALIDEVDLHLHPSWQQHVLKDLTQTFPNTQFIVTTHSPQVLSTVKRENIRVIGPDASGKLIAKTPLAMTYGEPSGDVLHSVMQVDPQPPVSEKADLQRLTALVDQGDYQRLEAKKLMQKLRNKLGEHHPQLQRLQRSIARQKALKS